MGSRCCGRGVWPGQGPLLRRPGGPEASSSFGESRAPSPPGNTGGDPVPLGGGGRKKPSSPEGGPECLLPETVRRLLPLGAGRSPGSPSHGLGTQRSPKTWAESEQQGMSTPLTASQPVRSQGVCAGPGEGVQGAGLEVLLEALGWGAEPTREVQRRPQTPGGTEGLRCPWRTRVVVRKPQPS